MRALVIVTLATSPITAAPNLHTFALPSQLLGFNGAGVNRASPCGLVARVDDVEVLYHKASCKGEKLLAATTSPHNAAAAFINPIDSFWTNAFFRARHPDECEFENSHKLKGMFSDLGIDTRSTYENGPNRCYYVEHKDGPIVQRDQNGNLPPVNQQQYTVNGRPYRVTNAEFTIGINAASGLITMTNRQSPATSAQTLWGLKNPPPSSQLPALRRSSDIMWGLWSLENPNDLRGIKYILSTPIVNDDTVAIIEKVLDNNCLELNELMVWSGCEFTANEPEYLALLGSSNGQAIGFFLAQHKRELGGKFVSKINIFKGETNFMLALCMLFTIEDKVGAARAALGGDANGVDRVGKPVVVKRGDYGKNIVRRHVVFAKF